MKLVWTAELDSRIGQLKLVWTAELDSRAGQLKLVWTFELNRIIGQLELVWTAELDGERSAGVGLDSSVGQRKIEVAVQIDGRPFLL